MRLQGSRLCSMCPSNLTNLQDGSTACSSPIVPGTNLRVRYAVIVSFGVLLNGTDLDEIASKVRVCCPQENQGPDCSCSAVATNKLPLNLWP